MPSVGTPESLDNFKEYELRFKNPNWSTKNPTNSSFWYSFSYHAIHFISFSTIHPFNTTSEQYAWLEADLKAVNPVTTPWIIAFGYTPFYSSNLAYNPPNGLQELENLFTKYKVNLIFSSQVHAYERTTPVFNFSTTTIGVNNTYTNAKSPIYIVTGTAGAPLDTQWSANQPSWSAFRIAEYGLTTVSIENSTHIQIQFISLTGKVLDSFWLINGINEGLDQSIKDMIVIIVVVAALFIVGVIGVFIYMFLKRKSKYRPAMD